MLEEGKIYLGTSRTPDDQLQKPEYLNLKLANRHGLITGATGTGKTVSLQILAEGLHSDRYCVAVNGIRMPLHATATPGQRVGAVRYRAWQPPRCLHSPRGNR